ncbi:MAG TPA: hypothetical protein VEZ40_16550 [Pyrinomonadaceae bacterium]|nr:hypothetical protein [Pyrinomonadaceae bacterium]
MNDTTKINNCERAGELVAYFYGEAGRAERESFDAHLARCGLCRDELAAFGEVREGFGQWRAEILKNAPALSLADIVAPGARRDTVSLAAAPRRSARAALREFFTLSPIWLRAGVAAAALAVCALVALVAANAEVRWDDEGGLAFSTRLRREAQSRPAEQVSAPGAKVSLQAELDKLVAERDAALRELEDTRAQLDDSRAANFIAAIETLEPASASRTLSAPDKLRRERRASPSPAAPPKPRRDERDEEDAPRLYDLLREAN